MRQSLALLSVLLILGCLPIGQETYVIADDGQKLGLTYLQPDRANPAMLVILASPISKPYWEGFAKDARSAGFAVALMDLRGSGKSGGSDLTDPDLAKMPGDVQAAISYLRSQGANEKRIALAGDGVGAMVALNYASRNGNVKSVLLVAPTAHLAALPPEGGKGYQGKAYVLTRAVKDLEGRHYSSSSPQEEVDALNALVPLLQGNPEVHETGVPGIKALGSLSPELLAWLDRTVFEG